MGYWVKINASTSTSWSSLNHAGLFRPGKSTWSHGIFLWTMVVSSIWCSLAGIYANIGGILMGSMLPYMAYMDPMGYWMVFVALMHRASLIGRFLFRHLRVFSAQFLASLVATHDQFGIRVCARVMENSTLGVEVLDGALWKNGFVPFCSHEMGLENTRNECVLWRMYSCSHLEPLEVWRLVCISHVIQGIILVEQINHVERKSILKPWW